MKKRYAKSQPVGRVAIAMTLVVLAVNSAFCQDTVRLNDPRFLYPQLPHGDFFFYRYLWELTPISVTPIESGHGHECFLENGQATIYGIAIALYCERDREFPYIGDSDHNELCLKIMDEIPLNLPLNTSNTLLDSVIIYNNVRVGKENTCFGRNPYGYRRQ